MQGNIFIRNNSGQMVERVITDGDGIVLNPGEEILIAAEADTTEIHYESDTRAVIRLEGIGEFSVESDTTLPEKIALAPPLALQGQQPLGISFEEASSPTGPELSILPDPPLMQQASTDSTSYADRPSTPPVDFIAPEALRFNFGYLSMLEGASSTQAGALRQEFDDFAAFNVFDYSTDGDTSSNLDTTASRPLLTLDIDAAGNEDTVISLYIRAGLTDTDGSETLTVIISGLPEGSVLSAGTDNGDGTWTLTEADLPGLTITPPQDWDQDFDITVTAISQESSTGDTASTSGTIHVGITPVNDPPVAGSVDLVQMNEDTSLTITAEQLLANSHDVDGDPLTVTDVSVNPHYGTVEDNGDGTWTFTPTPDFHGDDVALTFTVADPSGTWSSNVATIDVVSVNDAPVVGDVDLGDTHLETAVTFSGRQLLSNAYDVDGDTLTVTAVSVDPAQGAIAYDAATDIWTFTPAAGFTGEDVEISFTASDGQASASARALIDVTDNPSGNRPPVADDVDLGQMNEDASIRITATQLLAGTHDPDGDPRAIASLTVNPYYGTVTDNGDGSWTFTPTENFHGDDVALTFTVTDGKGGEATAVASVDVIEQPDLPVADSVYLGQINEDTSITFTAAQLLANSYDPDGDPMSIASVSVNPFYGTVTDNGDGTWTFTPAENFHGNDVALTFVVQDNGGTVSATAIVDVLGVNDAPVAGDVDLGQCQAGTERVIFAHELLAFSHDPDGDPLSVTSVSVDPAYGSVEGYGEGSWIFKPTEGFTGDDVAIRFTVSDGELTAGAVALVDVVDDPSGNRPPVILAPTYIDSTPEDTVLTFSASALLFNAYDPDGDPLTVISVNVDPYYGTVTDNGDGTWNFTPTENFHGLDIPLTFTVSDGRGGVSTGVGTVDVLPVNDPPVAGAVDLGQINEDHSLTITKAQLLANSFDVDGDVLDISSVTVDASVGTISDEGSGTWTFTPATNLNGDDFPISFTVTDGNGGTTTGTATIDILPVNDPPTAGDVSLGIINEDTSVTFSRHMLLSNSSDPEGGPFDLTGLSVLPEQGSLTANPDGTWTFTPAENFSGTAAITFTVTDTHGVAATAQAMVDVRAVNDPPVANDVAHLGQILEDSPVTFTSAELLSVIQNADGDTLSIASADVSQAQGSLTHDAATDTWTFTPAENFNGKVHIDYTVADGHGETGTGSAILDVLPVNDAPQLTPIAAWGTRFFPGIIEHLGATRTGTPFTFTEDLVKVFASDPDLEDLNINLSVNPDDGTITNNGDGTWTYTPSASLPSITDVHVTITAEDAAGATFEDSTTVLIRIENTTNLRPVHQDVTGTVQEDGSIILTPADILANCTDPEGDILRVTDLYIDPKYGSFSNGVWNYATNSLAYVTFTPAENFHGEVPILCIVEDGFRYNGTCGIVAYDKIMFMLNVVPVTDVGNVDLGQISEDNSLTFTEAQLLANSEDEGDPPSIASVSVDPAQGTLTHDGDVWTFTPAENFSGDVKISFTVAYTDEQLPAEASLTVLPVNDPPRAGDVDFGQSPDGAVYFTAAELLANSSDADGDALSVVAGSVSVHPDFGQILDMGEGSWMYLAPEGFAHQDVPISFRVSDGDLEVAATAVIDVDTHSANVPLVQTLALDTAAPLTVTQDSLTTPDHDGLTIAHVTGETGDALEIADQANWSHESSDADHHHLVSATGLVELYIDRDVDIHVVGGVDSTGSPAPSDDSLHVDDFFHTVLSGGGDDTITIDPLLHSDGHITPDDFTHIDGGDGFDVLKFGVDQALHTGTEMDLTALNAHQVENIEAIDITGNTDNTLTLDAASVIDVTDSGNALYVQGDGNDTVHVSDAASWTHAGTSDLGGATYDHYTGLDAFGTAADLYVQQHMQTNLLHP